MNKDKVIVCSDCKQQFPFTSGEQEYYQQKGLKAPTRCQICRGIYEAAKKDKFRGKVKK